MYLSTATMYLVTQYGFFQTVASKFKPSTNLRYRQYQAKYKERKWFHKHGHGCCMRDIIPHTQPESQHVVKQLKYYRASLTAPHWLINYSIMDTLFTFPCTLLNRLWSWKTRNNRILSFLDLFSIDEQVFSLNILTHTGVSMNCRQDV